MSCLHRNRGIISLCLVGLLAACDGESTPDSADTIDDTAADTGSDATEGGCSPADTDACVWPSRGRSVARFPSAAGAEYVVTDATTGRELPLLVRYPTDVTGPVPVVIWSHGGGFEDDGHTLSGEWGDTLAAHGYAVIHLAHVTIDGDMGRQLCALAGVPAEECGPGTVSFGAIARPLDVRAVLDDLHGVAEALQAAGGPELDETRVAVAGHSAGSQAGLVLRGAVRELTPSVPRYAVPDDRPLAIIGLSPQGPGFSGFFEATDETSWDAVAGPTLLVTGDNDVNPSNPDLFGSVRRRAYDNLPGASGAQRLLFARTSGGHHGSFNLEDLDTQDAELSALHDAMRSVVRAFLDAHLRDDASAVAYLDSDAPRLLMGEGDWEAK